MKNVMMAEGKPCEVPSGNRAIALVLLIFVIATVLLIYAFEDGLTKRANRQNIPTIEK